MKRYYSNANGYNVSFMFQPVTEQTVINIQQSLNSNKATDLDKIPPRFLKDGAKFITAHLTYIFNLSMSQGKIPSAKITPIYKKQNKAEAGNYRPISILSDVSKLFLRRLFMTNLTRISQITNYYTSISQVSGPPIHLIRV